MRTHYNDLCCAIAPGRGDSAGGRMEITTQANAAMRTIGTLSRLRPVTEEA
jgi:hypothetical protein